MVDVSIPAFSLIHRQLNQLPALCLKNMMHSISEKAVYDSRDICTVICFIKGTMKDVPSEIEFLSDNGT